MQAGGGVFLGFGLSETAGPADVLEAAVLALARLGLSLEAVLAFATIDRRADHPAIARVEAVVGKPVVLFSSARLEAETPRLKNPSEAIFRLTGCHGVAEAAALALAGPSAMLLVEKTRVGRVTVALSRRC